MPEMKLDVVDAAELAELLQFLGGWLARDPDRLGASLAGYVGHPAYGTAQLRQDLDRFTFLLGGDDGEQEGEPVQILAQLSGAVGRVADEGFQRDAEPVRLSLIHI